MFAFGRCCLLVTVAIDVSDGNNDCTDAADVGEVSSRSYLMFPLLLLLVSFKKQ